jgi:hypothetical protein
LNAKYNRSGFICPAFHNMPGNQSVKVVHFGEEILI